MWYKHMQKIYGANFGSIFIGTPLCQLKHNKNKNIPLQWNDHKYRYIKKNGNQTWKGEEKK